MYMYTVQWANSHAFGQTRQQGGHTAVLQRSVPAGAGSVTQFTTWIQPMHAVFYTPINCCLTSRTTVWRTKPTKFLRPETIAQKQERYLQSIVLVSSTGTHRAGSHAFELINLCAHQWHHAVTQKEKSTIQELKVTINAFADNWYADNHTQQHKKLPRAGFWPLTVCRRQLVLHDEFPCEFCMLMPQLCHMACTHHIWDVVEGRKYHTDLLQCMCVR
jgi:hypothetical protein